MRTTFAHSGPIQVPDGLADELVLFLSDIVPTGFMAADFRDSKGGETARWVMTSASTGGHCLQAYERQQF